MATACGFSTSFSVGFCDLYSDRKFRTNSISNAIRNRDLSSRSLACFPPRTQFLNNDLKCKIVSPKLQRLNPRCEAQAMENSEIKSKHSSLLALESLKSSATDRYTKETSSIVIVGLNYRTAPIELREKLSISEAQWPEAISELCALNHIEEAAVLSTCNRMEIYFVALSQNRGVKEVTQWMSKISSVPVSELNQHTIVLSNEDATRHLFEVSSGLDSLVLGEGQILSQVKQVVNSGQNILGFDIKMNGLFKRAITVGKRVRTETSISRGSVSVSSAAVELASMKLPESSHANTLVVGAGKMGKLVIKHLAAKGCKKIVVVNRTEEKVNSIREEMKDVEIDYKPVSEMLTCAAQADVIFTCTASKDVIFSKEQVQTLPIGQRLFIDISVPRTVGASVSDIENVQVYNVDDLKDVVAANKEDRLQKSMEARSIIEEEVKQFEAWKDSLETVPTIKKLRAYAERIRACEVEKCLSKMGDGITKNQQKAIYALSLGIVNKLLHGPMQHLKCDGGDGRGLSEILENMHALSRIYELDKDTPLLEEKVRAKVESK